MTICNAINLRRGSFITDGIDVVPLDSASCSLSKKEASKREIRIYVEARRAQSERSADKLASKISY